MSRQITLVLTGDELLSIAVALEMRRLRLARSLDGRGSRGQPDVPTIRALRLLTEIDGKIQRALGLADRP